MRRKTPPALGEKHNYDPQVVARDPAAKAPSKFNFEPQLVDKPSDPAAAYAELEKAAATIPVATPVSFRQLR